MDVAQTLTELAIRFRADGADHARVDDPELRAVARQRRADLARAIDAQLGPFDPLFLRAIRDVPRELFVRAVDRERSADDIPLPLDDLGLATISAPHAYLLSFRLLHLAMGDRLIELGSGSGYGAALASYIVGDRGHVTTIEIDPPLYERARTLLARVPNILAVHDDAEHSTRRWGAATKIVVTFAIDRLPEAWLTAIPEGGLLVAPVGARDRDQQLTRVERRGGTLVMSEHGSVRYVKNRSPR